jgi:hypothetical protein
VEARKCDEDPYFLVVGLGGTATVKSGSEKELEESQRALLIAIVIVICVKFHRLS